MLHQPVILLRGHKLHNAFTVLPTLIQNKKGSERKMCRNQSLYWGEKNKKKTFLLFTPRMMMMMMVLSTFYHEPVECLSIYSFLNICILGRESKKAFKRIETFLFFIS